MGGEIGLKIAEIKFSDDNVAPYKDGWRYAKVAIDATLIDENGIIYIYVGIMIGSICL